LDVHEKLRTDLVYGLAFSADGRTVMVSNAMDSVWILNLTNWDVVELDSQISSLASGRYSLDAGKTLDRYELTQLWHEPDCSIGRLTAACLSHDGRKALVGGEHGAMIIDMTTGPPNIGYAWKSGKRPEDQVQVVAVAFSPDGRTAATGTERGVVRLWDTASGQLVGEPLRHEGKVVTLAFSPDARTVLAASTFYRYTRTGHGTAVYSATLLDAATGRPVGQPIEHEVARVAFSPDGRIVATSGSNHKIQLWDGATGQTIAPPLENQGQVYALAFSGAGGTLLTGGNRAAELWNTDDCRLGVPRLSHHDAVRCAALSPDGRTALTGSDDGTARLWDLATGRPLAPPLELGVEVGYVAFSPDARTVLTFGHRNFSLDPSQWWWELHGPAHNVLTVGASNVAIWDLATGQAIEPPVGIRPASNGNGNRDQRDSPKRTRGRYVQDTAFGPGGPIFLIGDDDGTMRRWDMYAGRPPGPIVKCDPKLEAATRLSPDGQTMLTVHKDGKARLWGAISGQLHGSPLEHTAGPGPPSGSQDGGRDRHVVERDGQRRDHVHQAEFSPDGRLVLTSAAGGKSRLWDATKGLPVGPLFDRELYPSWYSTRVFGFGPDARTDLVGDYPWTFLVELWDAAAGRRLGPPMESDELILTAALCPDGRTVLTGDDGGTVRLWNAATGRQVGPPLKHGSEVLVVKVSSDGRTALSGGSRGSVRLWDVTDWPLAWAADFTPRIEAITGMTLDDRGEVRDLDTAEWVDRVSGLASRGVQLYQRPRWSLDPILYGPQPTARAKAWIERGRWAEAEAAFDEAVKTEPEDGLIRAERGRFFAARSRPDRAAVEFAEALSLNVLHALYASYVSISSNHDAVDAAQKARAEFSREILADRATGDRVRARVPKAIFDLLDPVARAQYWTELGRWSAEQKRWAEAEVAYHQALAIEELRGDPFQSRLDAAMQIVEKGREGERLGPNLDTVPFPDVRQLSTEQLLREHEYWRVRASILIERGRHFITRGRFDDAARDYSDALHDGISASGLAKDILANTAVRDRVFARETRWCREEHNDSDGFLSGIFQGEVLDAVFPKDPFAR
jgi:WD40 repeat protein/tetratricopeptide (TPR) repeat protein